MCGHPEEDMELVKTVGSSIREEDRRALGKGGMGTVSADFSLPPFLAQCPRSGHNFFPSRLHFFPSFPHM